MIQRKWHLSGQVMSTIASFVLLMTGAEARMEFDGSGVSRIWTLLHEGVVVSRDLDDDFDGISNFAEGIAGTDPFDGASLIRLHISEVGEEGLNCAWEGEAGKFYQIQSWDPESKLWNEVASALPSDVDGPRTIMVPWTNPGIFRLAVSDIDADGDGLSAWEEIQLGLSDLDAASSGVTGEGDFLTALRQLEDPEGMLTSGGIRLAPMRPSRKEAARFLMKASFGPNEDSIDRVLELGFTGWIDEQMGLPASSLYRVMFSNGLSWSESLARHGWWRMANLAEDQLRQRMAYALSQILVVNLEKGTWVGDNPLVHGRYYDIFTEGAFGPYRDVLEKVTYSPVMGFYLSHLKNRKTDNPANPSRFPDENFAREIMQLFSIGLWELNPDGSRKLDNWDRFIPTYDNGTITEMAKVFTGMSFTTTNNGREATSFFDIPRGNDFLNPMKVWDEEHEPGPKSIINGVQLDGTQTGEEEVQAAIDALMSHDAMAPFLSRLLIQRFTSSNPSRGYLARVSRVWNNSVGDDEDHLGKVVTAILLDPESLNLNIRNEFAGKVREPMIRFVALARAFEMSSPENKYAVVPYGLRSDFGQFPMMARSVFNFYSPDYAPNGDFRRRGMVSPEMELSSMSQLLLSDGQFAVTSIRGEYQTGDFDYSRELELAPDPEALLDRVDLLLTGGRLAPASRAAILTAIQNQTSDLWRVRVAIYLVSQSMESVVLQ